MPFREFDGDLDGDKKESSSGYVPFDGELDAPAPAAAAPKRGLIDTITNAARGVGDFVAGAGDALRNVPIVPPEGQAKRQSIMERLEAGERAPAPEGITPFTWDRAQRERGREAKAPATAELTQARGMIQEQAAKSGKVVAGVLAKARGDNLREQRDAEQYSAENIAGNTVKNLRNTTASVLKIGPTAVKGVADIARLLSGDTIGKDASESLAARMKVIDEVVAHASLTEQGKEFSALMADKNAGIGDLFGYLLDNPEVLVDQGITTIGSMFLPAGAAMGAVGAGRALGAGAGALRTGATVASMGTVAAQNAAGTFTSDELKNESLSNRYQGAAVSAAVSMLAGIATKGGAEGEIARRIAGDLTAGRTTVQAAKAFIVAAAREGAQEATEEFGGAAGEAVGSGTPMDANNTGKRMAFAATLGAVMGGGTNLVTSNAPAVDDGAAAAEAARQAALNRWNTDGLRPGAPAAPAPAARREPTWGDIPGVPQAAAPTTPDAPPPPSIDDIGAATTVDEAIAAAQAVVSTPTSTPPTPFATAADIEALEEQYGLSEPAPTIERDAGMPLRPTGLVDSLGQPGIPSAVPLADAGAPTAEQQDALADEDTWYPFPAETGTLGVPRAEMPQIKAEHRGAMTQFLAARGITHEQVELEADELKPTQAEFSLGKVQKAVDYVGGNRSILVSSDGHVLDGHHQWLAAAEKGEPVKAIRLNAPIAQLLETVKEFPSAGVDTASAPDTPGNAKTQEGTPEDDGIDAMFDSMLEEVAPSSALESKAADSGLLGTAAPKAPTRAGDSWVIRNKTTGEVIAETYDRKKVDALNTAKYEAVPARQHLEELNTPGTLANRTRGDGGTTLEEAGDKFKRQDDEVAQAAANIEARKQGPGVSPDAAWRKTEFAPRIEAIAKQLRDAGDEGMARAIENGVEMDASRGKLTEEIVEQREGVARQTLARLAAKNGGTITPAKIEPMTAERFIAEIADTAGALPRKIVDAGVAKWNELAPQLAALGYKFDEVHTDGPAEARAIQRQLHDIANAFHSLAPRRYQQAKHADKVAKYPAQLARYERDIKAGKKDAKKPTNPGKFDKSKLNRSEDAATAVLGINTRKHPGINTTNPITLGAGVSDPKVRSQEAKAQTGRLRERIKRDNPFLAMLGNHGVAIKDHADIGLDKGPKGRPMIPGYGPMFRHAGKRLDELALLAVDEGFLTQADIDSDSDTGGTRKLAELILRAVTSKEVIKPAGMLEAAMPSTDERLLAEAEGMGIDTTGMTAEEVYDAVVAEHAEREQYRQAIAKATGEAVTVEDQAQAEDDVDALTMGEQALAFELLQDADIPLDGGLSSDNLTEEDLDAIFGPQSRRPAQVAAGETESDATAAPSPDAGGTAAPQQSGEDLLSSYTPAEVRAREDAADAAAKAKQAERDRLEAQRKKAQDEADIRARLDASADNFQLGQDAMDSLAGQGSIFDAPAATPAVAPEPQKADGALGLQVVKSPSGKFIYRGSVPDAIGYEDGATAEQIKNGKQFGERFGPKQRRFDTAQQAVDYAAQRGFLASTAPANLNPMSERSRAKYEEGDWATAYDGGMMPAGDARSLLKQLESDNPGNEYRLASVGKMAEIEVRKRPSETGEQTPIQKQMAEMAVPGATPPLLSPEPSLAQRLLKKDKHVFAQPRLQTYNPYNARPLLLIACSDKKQDGNHAALDLYKGVMFDVLRKWMPTRNAPDVYIISAKHGLVHASDLLDNYEQPMTAERLEALMVKGIDVRKFVGKDFSEVFIAGGAAYRELAQTYVERLKKVGHLNPDADASGVEGGIGEQRGQLGEYLRGLEARADDDTDARDARIAEIQETQRQWRERMEPLQAEQRAKDDAAREQKAKAAAARKFKRGDMLVSSTGRLIELLDDPDYKNVDAIPGRATPTVRAQYIGERQKIKGRWQTPTESGLFATADILKNYTLAPPGTRLNDPKFEAKRREAEKAEAERYGAIMAGRASSYQPDTRFEEEVLEQAGVIGEAADPLVAQFESGELDADQLQAELEQLQKDQANPPAASDADIDAMFDTMLDEVAPAEPAPAPIVAEKEKLASTRKKASPLAAPGIPLAFYKKVTVERDVFAPGADTATVQPMRADQAIKAVRTDIENLQALRNCMKG